ncbi:hypothetical protein AURDEDRAFT_146993 [Auricularia subglabra TFB-10046 SS5]|uniref:Uncharacterized protein n=1 Tax=Auricularia subglabra (strain TFB-10046 / SS5) TaxID=717982 RepID=J0WW57_AURST|nr:hypothetical protein AURDEDRAFT_146993 [Auricularia subglabra TFB-10046 SS5]
MPAASPRRTYPAVQKWVKAALALARNRWHRPEPPPRPAASESAPGRRVLCLSDLPVDILELLVVQLQNLPSYTALPGASGIRAQHPRSAVKALIPVSMVSRSMRGLCLPLLFRTVWLRNSGCMPENIYPFVQIIYIGLVDVVAYQTQVELMLQQMPRLSCVYWADAGRCGQIEGLSCLAVASALRVLILKSIWLTAEMGPLPETLRELHMYHHDARAIDDQLPPDILPAHFSCLERLLTTLWSQLECLTLYGEGLRSSLIAAYHWPVLRDFAVIGRSPILDTPWMHVLQRMPQVQSFTLLTDAFDGRTPICPSALTPTFNVAQLRRLSLSFPRPDDAIFSYLSPDLVELALRDAPRYYNVRWEYYDKSSEPILSCPNVMHIFGAFSACGLRALELVYLEDEFETDMLATVAQACPGLTMIELHRYRRFPFSYLDWRNVGKSSVPVEAIARSLANFRALQMAKLNLSFTKANIDAIEITEFWRALDAFLDTQAQIIAHHVPWLECMALLTRTRSETMYWAVWDIQPEMGCRRLRDGGYNSGGNILLPTYHRREWDWL